MLGKIFGKKNKKEIDPLKERISQMNLNDLVLYAKGKIDGLEFSEEGLVEVLKRLISKINDKRYFLDKSDDDTKLKKAFDLVLLCAKSNKITVKGMELIAEFVKHYEALIKKYDKEHKEIYHDRLVKAIETATQIIEMKVALQNKMSMLD